jgi:hypothetical protein
VSGFRMDAVPFLIERKGAGVKPIKDYELLHELREPGEVDLPFSWHR